MNKIYYLDDELLVHLHSRKKTNSFIWKIMYKRVMKNLNQELINAHTLKEIIFSKQIIHSITYHAPLPNVTVQKGSTWLLGDDEKDYYIPISLSFSNEKIRFDIVLIDGEIDLRNIIVDKNKIIQKHNPILLVKNLKVLELCFELLLDQVRSA